MKKRVYTTPEQKREIMLAAGLMPLSEFEHKDKPWKSKCLKCGKEVSPRFGSIRNGQGGCKYCAGLLIDPEDAVNILNNAGFEALEPYGGSVKPWKSRCNKCGNISFPRLGNINSLGTGCKFCSAIQRGQDSKLSSSEIFESLRKVNIELVGALEYEDSKHKVLCRCKKCERTFSKSLNLIRNGQGCPFCSGKKVDPEEAVTLMFSQGVQPLEAYPGSSRPWKSKCLTCNREVTPSYVSVKRGAAACAYCAGKRVDLQEASETLGNSKLLALEPYPGASKPWKCECLVCGRHTSPTLSNLKRGHGGCLKCAGKLVEPEDANQTMLDAGLIPLEPYRGRHTPWNCRCLKCDRDISPTYGSVSRGSGCKYCAEIGIDYTASGYVYLIAHQSMQSYKIGIANSQPRKKYYDRLLQHELKGWVLVSKFEFTTAEIAMKVEQEFLKWVREVLGLGIYLSKKEMPQGGYTETFSGHNPVNVFADKLANIAEKYS